MPRKGFRKNITRGTLIKVAEDQLPVALVAEAIARTLRGESPYPAEPIKLAFVQVGKRGYCGYRWRICCPYKAPGDLLLQFEG